ncbi:recombinase family protein [Pseudooceanicola nitratireducens]|uniref:recombinase family protein n=1 Tax=Pseudooceanicola nitratireducens TaxID=517719 RepID=UPI001C940330|nr:recombinase family protein [Pseudooceanicola nitratireducens]MBY6155928.1 recombinase family protein [Pseudooceanicola nitratireducens]
MIQSTKPVRVAIYARYSTDLQNPTSIEDQVRLCRQHAARQDRWTVVQVFEDVAISGATRGRPGFEALQAFFAEGGCDIVLFEHLDRLARDLELLMLFYKKANYADVEMHQLHRGKLGIFDIGILGTFAQLFLEELSHKTRRGLVGRVEAGKNTGGRAYGYRSEALPLTNGKSDGSVMRIDPEEAAIVRRIFEEYAAGKSPRQIAADLNAAAVPAPRGRGAGSGHWKANTIYGHRARGTGILNNELYIGRHVWNRQRYSKHPETGRRVSKPNPPEEWLTTEKPELRIVDEALWDKVKARQDLIDSSRTRAEADGKTGAGAAQSARRRKYLLSGLLTCGQCGGNLTVAGKGARRRYYCANAKEKGEAVCTGMPGLSEADAAETVLGGLREGLMQEKEYEQFRASYVAKMRADEQESGQVLQRHDARIREVQKTYDKMMAAVENGDYSPPVIRRLNAADAELTSLRAERETLIPAPIELPDDIPALYREHVEDLVGTLTDEAVAGPAADELHTLVETVVVSWDDEAGLHTLENRGKLLELLSFADSKKTAALLGAACSLKLVAGVGFEPTTFRL